MTGRIGMTNRVLTYGIFRKDRSGESPGFKHIMTTNIYGFKMYTNGSFPYIIPTVPFVSGTPINQDKDKAYKITVDLFEVTDAVLKYMDAVEGTPYHYTRERVAGMGFIYIPAKQRWTQIKKTLRRVDNGDFLTGAL